MKKLLILIIVSVTLGIVTGCAGLLPDAHKIDIQQGNVLSQSALNQLQPGMNKRQVRYLLGSPLISDAFHKERWDYIYTFEKAGKLLEHKHISLYFEDDVVIGVTGDMKPEAADSETKFDKETIVVVNPPEVKRGWFMRALGYIGLADDE
jgi:outer membrane protein assembly factor BamE